MTAADDERGFRRAASGAVAAATLVRSCHRAWRRQREAAENVARQAEAAPIALLFKLLLGFSFLFMAVPGIDLSVAAWFAGPRGGFPLQSHSGLLFLRELNQAATLALLATAVASLLVAAANRRSRWVMRPHKALFLLSVYAAGPGLLVNIILKNLFGRARPRELAEFGGTLDFSGPWQVASGCSGNCSFSSGEAASAAAMLALALIVPQRWRVPVFAGLALPAVLFSLNRIAFGGHFLSDVVLSWLLVAIVMLLIRAPVMGNATKIDGLATGLALPASRAVADRFARLRCRLPGPAPQRRHPALLP